MSDAALSPQALPADHFLMATRPLGGLDGSLTGQIPDGWQQGRGAFGGLVVGLLLRAMQSAEPEPERRLRTLTAELCGPVLPGEVKLEVSQLRRGSGLSCFDARLVQNGEVQARASAVLARARAGVPSPVIDPPSPRPASEVAVLRMDPPFGPPFARHIEYRPTGPAPFSGGKDPVVEGWVRLRVPCPIDAAVVAGLLDSYWPAFFSVVDAPRAAATVSFTMELLCDPASLPPEEPLYYRSIQIAGDEGFLVELRELWTAKGERVGMNQQTFAVIK